MNNTARLAEIDRLLGDVPKFECLPGCSDCCGPVIMSRLEHKRLVAANSVPTQALTTANMLKRGCLNCPLLDTTTHRCSQYEIRPAICRIFGASEHPRLKCPHGQAPDKPMTIEQTNTLIDRCMELGLGYSEPMENLANQFLAQAGKPTLGTPTPRANPLSAQFMTG